MGYYTQFGLKVIGAHDELINEFRAECENADRAFDDFGCSQDSQTWHAHEMDLRPFSRKHPYALFTLYGFGEESDDIWEEHYKDGKMQRCEAKIIIPEFDASLLK